MSVWGAHLGIGHKQLEESRLHGAWDLAQAATILEHRRRDLEATEDDGAPNELLERKRESGVADLRASDARNGLHNSLCNLRTTQKA